MRFTYTVLLAFLFLGSCSLVNTQEIAIREKTFLLNAKNEVGKPFHLEYEFIRFINEPLDYDPFDEAADSIIDPWSEKHAWVPAYYYKEFLDYLNGDLMINLYEDGVWVDEFVPVYDQEFNDILIVAGYNDFIASELTHPKPYSEYEIEFLFKDGRAFYSKSKVPSQINLLDVFSSNTPIDLAGFGKAIDLRLTFLDPENERNYYKIELLRASSRYHYSNQSDSTLLEFFFPVYLLNNNGTDDSFGFADFEQWYESKSVFLSDEVFDGALYEMQVFVPLPKENFGGYIEPGNNYIVRLSHITDSYYNYMMSISNQLRNDGAPFSTPTFIQTNVEKGAGIFTISNSTQLPVEFYLD